MRLLSAFCVPSWCHFGMLCVCPGLAAAQRRLSWAEQAQHSWSVLCSDVFRVVLPANAGQQQEGCGGQMFPWTFCRTKSLKNMEGVSPWKELLHGRSFSKPGFQKVSQAFLCEQEFFQARLSTWNCDINEKQGRGGTLVAGVTSGRV